MGNIAPVLSSPQPAIEAQPKRAGTKPFITGWLDDGAPSHVIHLLTALWSHFGNIKGEGDGHVWPSVRSMSRCAGLSRSTVYRALRWCREHGAIAGGTSVGGRRPTDRWLIPHGNALHARGVSSDGAQLPVTPTEPAADARGVRVTPLGCQGDTRTTRELEIQAGGTEHCSEPQREVVNAQQRPPPPQKPPKQEGPSGPSRPEGGRPSSARAEIRDESRATELRRLRDLYVELAEELGVRRAAPADAQITGLLLECRIQTIEAVWRRDAKRAKHAAAFTSERKAWQFGWNLKAQNVKRSAREMAKEPPKVASVGSPPSSQYSDDPHFQEFLAARLAMYGDR